MPGISSLKRFWSGPVTDALSDNGPAFVLDLRSEAYVALGPIPEAVGTAYVRVVADDENGTRALNHFNKKAKGELVRALAQQRPPVGSLVDLLDWADTSGARIRQTQDERIVELVVARGAAGAK